MNELETNLSLWAICSIILFEILALICLFRWCINRLRPKKFYLKRNEYEYLQDINSNAQTKYPATILRPPHADELAMVGTFHETDRAKTYEDKGVQNAAFFNRDEDQRAREVSSSSSSSQHWLDLNLPIISTAQLPPAEYEIHSHPKDSYTFRHASLPRLKIVNLETYPEKDYPIDYDDCVDSHHLQVESYSFESFRRPQIIQAEVQRIDTSTEFYGMNYSNIVPKSILKSTTSITPPIDFLSSPYLQTQYSSTSSDSDESQTASIRISLHQAASVKSPYSIINERKVPIKSILSTSTTTRMKFAEVNILNDVEWEYPKEMATTMNNRQIFDFHSVRDFSLTDDPKISVAQRRELNRFQVDSLSKSDTTQQQAFEY